MGNYAVDVTDVTQIPLTKLMKYNLIDCLATAYVYETYYPKMIEESQDNLYYEFMLPTLKTNIRCQLNGFPIDINLVKDFETKLYEEEATLLKEKGIPFQYNPKNLTIDFMVDDTVYRITKVTIVTDGCISYENFNEYHLGYVLNEDITAI